MIALFLTFVAHRFASGIRNGAMYAQKNKLAKAFIYIIGALIGLSIKFVYPFSGLPSAPHCFTYALGGIAIGVSCICSVMCALWMSAPDGKGFFNLLRRDLHFWMIGEQGGLALGIVILGGLHTIPTLLCCVYPAVFLQKSAINILSGYSPFYNGTDDPTGKTFSVPILGVKVPRTGQKFRLAMAFVSVVLFIWLVC